MIDMVRPLDLDHPEADEFLRGIQGNIVKGHGRKRTAHILLPMTGEPDAVHHWIVRFARRSATSAFAAAAVTTAWKAEGGPGEPLAMVLLAPTGYRYVGFTDAQLPRPVDWFGQASDADYFRLGMKRQAELRHRFNTAPSAEWELPYQGDIDAMVLLADNDEARLDGTVAAVRAALDGILEVLTVERGKELTRTFPRRGELTIEHFGFQDGVSQPIMVQQDLDAELAQRGGVQWNRGAPLSLALVPDPGGPGGFGSFMVFRKLEQNVTAFWAAVEILHAQFVVDQPRLVDDDVGAMAVGRYPDGLPTVPAPPIHDGTNHNDFHFGVDPDGRPCPFHAHIRKTNPRGDVPALLSARLSEFERARRIVRRGITYGNRPELAPGTPPDRPTDGVGLLFMCVQANLDQFAIQQEDADGDDFVRPGVGPDAVVGQNPDPLPRHWPSTGTATFAVANFVKLLGGEYFFAPSMGNLTAGMPR